MRNKLIFSLSLIGMLLCMFLWLQFVTTGQCEMPGKLLLPVKGLNTIVLGFTFFGVLAILSFLKSFASLEAFSFINGVSIGINFAAFVWFIYLAYVNLTLTKPSVFGFILTLIVITLFVLHLLEQFAVGRLTEKTIEVKQTQVMQLLSIFVAFSIFLFAEISFYSNGFFLRKLLRGSEPESKDTEKQLGEKVKTILRENEKQLISIVKDAVIELAKNPPPEFASLLKGVKATEKKEEGEGREEKPKIDRAELEKGIKYIYGAQKPDVFIVVFTDTLCPYCARAHKIIKELIDKNKDMKIGCAMRFLPIHGEASRVTMKMVLAAGEQNKYFEMLDKMFSHDAAAMAVAGAVQKIEEDFYKEEIDKAGGVEKIKAMEEEEQIALVMELRKKASSEIPKKIKASEEITNGLKKVAEELSLDFSKFVKDMERSDFDELIQNDSNLAVKAGVKGTPGIFINGKFAFRGLPESADVILQYIKNEIKK